ncbi:hypothetical protein GCM10012320_04920 [Sinomonas cellulolyticus]|nr:hypothetical protein GCM10012320_04920 [Sinomonas sp. KCTC 49339]
MAGVVAQEDADDGDEPAVAVGLPTSSAALERAVGSSAWLMRPAYAGPAAALPLRAPSLAAAGRPVFGRRAAAFRWERGG